MSRGSKKGRFIGDSHDDGGIPSEVVETGQKIEIEGDEYYICREAYNSNEIFEFKSKTNLQVLDTLYTKFSCKLVQSKMSAGDFIICKVVVKDNKKHNRKGTIKQILNEMQGEKSCRVETGSQRNRRQGGGIGSVTKFSKQEQEQFDEWIEDGNAHKNKNGKWTEQTTQWKKEFTLNELKAFFKREFLSYAKGGGVKKTKSMRDIDVILNFDGLSYGTNAMSLEEIEQYISMNKKNGFNVSVKKVNATKTEITVKTPKAPSTEVISHELQVMFSMWKKEYIKNPKEVTEKTKGIVEDITYQYVEEYPVDSEGNELEVYPLEDLESYWDWLSWYIIDNMKSSGVNTFYMNYKDEIEKAKNKNYTLEKGGKINGYFHGELSFLNW
jgi:hypothetical protein